MVRGHCTEVKRSTSHVVVRLALLVLGPPLSNSIYTVKYSSQQILDQLTSPHLM